MHVGPRSKRTKSVTLENARRKQNHFVRLAISISKCQNKSSSFSFPFGARDVTCHYIPEIKSKKRMPFLFLFNFSFLRFATPAHIPSLMKLKKKMYARIHIEIGREVKREEEITSQDFARFGGSGGKWFAWGEVTSKHSQGEKYCVCFVEMAW